MYLLRYFKGVKRVDCQMKPRLIGDYCPRIAVERDQAWIPSQSFVSYRIAWNVLCNAKGKSCQIQFNLQEELQLRIADHKIWDSFNAMNGVEPKNIYRNGAFQWADISQLCVWKSPPQSKKRVLLVCPNFEKGGATTSGKSIIHDMFILNLVFLKTVNNFNASRPFGL